MLLHCRIISNNVFLYLKNLECPFILLCNTHKLLYHGRPNVMSRILIWTLTHGKTLLPWCTSWLDDDLNMSIVSNAPSSGANTSYTSKKHDKLWHSEKKYKQHTQLTNGRVYLSSSDGNTPPHYGRHYCSYFHYWHCKLTAQQVWYKFACHLSDSITLNKIIITSN